MSSSSAAAATVFRLRPMRHNTAPSGESRRSRFAVPVAPRKQRRTPTILRSRSLMCGRVPIRPIQANLAADPSIAEADRLSDVLYEETLRVERTAVVEGKVRVGVEWEEQEDGGGLKGKLVVGCDLDGKWTLHWGVTYFDQIGSEWDQPSEQMRPPGSVPIKDYAIETPLEKSSSCSEGQSLHQLKIDLDSSMSIAAIHFVLKDEETGTWFQHRGRDFKIPLLEYPRQDDETVCGQRNFAMWPSSISQISSLLLKHKGSQLDANSQDNSTEDKDIKHDSRHTKGFYEEYQILKEEKAENCITVMVKKCDETNKNKLFIDTDIPGEVVVHWGVCRDDKKTWEVSTLSLPPESIVFRGKAIQTLLQQKINGVGSSGIFLLDEDISGVLFVLKLNEYTWVKNMGDNFFIPLINESMYSQMRSKLKNTKAEQEMNVINDMNVTTENDVIEESSQTSSQTFKSEIDDGQEVAYTNGIITGIRNLVTGITSEKSKSTKSKEEQENILQEIEKLASEAYNMFRSSVPIFSEESTPDTETVKLPVVYSSGTGSGYEILCQGFNWESHKSGRWYNDILTKAEELANFGFTTIWLPPPTESVSPEGYMPKDLYNLNSRYGNIKELRAVVKRLHEVGIKVLGDVVLNHRCAHYKNQHGIWNIFGGRLNWDDRAIVNDDPHFQGKGNKSSGDNFHAAPNIDHSQDFVRKDIKEWLCWLRKEIGYDGWRLDFARGFWGGYVREYLDATEPFFAVGEYWDSLSYTYGQMDHNQNAHRQRIVDWINATNGTAGAFDVTTKGILHTALEKCEYWRLSDDKGKAPGVIGWWPSRAVTFIENHDTGSTQGHWRFPAGKEMQGYAYILTHPGTPTVFYDHIYSHLQQEIAYLISLRHRLKIHCRSVLKITTLERDVYAAIIDDRVAMKIGPGRYEPPSYPNSWTVAAEGKDYKVWESS